MNQIGFELVKQAFQQQTTRVTAIHHKQLVDVQCLRFIVDNDLEYLKESPGISLPLNKAIDRDCNMAPPQRKEKKVNKGKPPPIDKLIVPAIGLAIGIVAFQFIKGIIRADVSDA